jgi:hypothetical protein
MAGSDVLALFRQAMTDGDPAAMRAGLEQLFGIASGAGVSAEDEYDLRSPGYVMEMPQSGERIRGRDAMRRMQEEFPNPPRIALRRVVGAGRVWVVEGVNDYGGGDVWHVVLVLELDEDGRMLTDTRYYSQRIEAPAWRAPFVEPIG